jgi:acetyl-CoA acetyltransferase
VAAAAAEIECKRARVALVLTADRVSNGPQIYYPNPPGEGKTEDWVQNNFACDPLSEGSMLDTAERVAAQWHIETAEQNEVTLRRYEQYSDATANDSAFLRRFMTLPFAVPNEEYSGTRATLSGDEGIYPTTRETLAPLVPVIAGGTVTRGGQTHPADGNAGMVVCRAELASEFARDSTIRVDIVGFATARERMGFMPAAPVPATRRVLETLGLKMTDISAIKSHNPFIVNDIVFARELKTDISKMNNFGCSLVWGHPQGPTALRCLIELIEELAQKGGGYGLFQGCAAGDTAMATVVKVH